MFKETVMGDAPEIITPEGGRFGAKQGFYYGIAEEAFVECVALAAERRAAPAATERWSDEGRALAVGGRPPHQLWSSH